MGTLEEYGDFIFAHGRYNTLENLDLKIRKSPEAIDTIEDNHTLENQNHPFGKGTHPGNLLVGLLMEIYRSTYHFETPLETLQNKAENIPSKTPKLQNSKTQKLKNSKTSKLQNSKTPKLQYSKTP